MQFQHNYSSFNIIIFRLIISWLRFLSHNYGLQILRFSYVAEMGFSSDHLPKNEIKFSLRFIWGYLVFLINVSQNGSKTGCGEYSFLMTLFTPLFQAPQWTGSICRMIKASPQAWSMLSVVITERSRHCFLTFYLHQEVNLMWDSGVQTGAEWTDTAAVLI